MYRKLNNDQRIGVWAIVVILIGLAILMIFSIIKAYFDAQAAANPSDPNAQDGFIGFLVIFVIVGFIGLVVIALSAGSMILGRWMRRRDAAFEASIATLSPAEQAEARHRRTVQEAAVATGAAVAGIAALRYGGHRAQEDLVRTRARWDAVQARQDAHSAQTASWGSQAPAVDLADYDRPSYPQAVGYYGETLESINRRNGYPS
jgi:hypothetical protein